MYSCNTSRIVIAGTASGVGKTTVSLAIMTSLTKIGLDVQGYKCGPDFIDPAYYKMVTGNPGRNLDEWMIGTEATKASFIHAAAASDIAVIEGVMGLFDGKAHEREGTTSGVSKLLDAPVILVIDCSKMGSSTGAIAQGFQGYDKNVKLRGFILNNIGSERHADIVRKSVEDVTGLSVVGILPRDSKVSIGERHLGLMTSIENPSNHAVVKGLGEISEHIDVEKVLAIANDTRGLVTTDSQLFDVAEGCSERKKTRIAVAYDKAFNFYYQDNLDILCCLGAEIEYFSPVEDALLPEEIDGLYIGGGYPEVHAQALSQNESLRNQIKMAAEAGLPIFSECAGYIYLSNSIRGFDGEEYPMCGVVPASFTMADKPVLGYREAIAAVDSIVTGAGDRIRGHEFHYSRLVDTLTKIPLFTIENNHGDVVREGFATKNVAASYIHTNFAGYPRMAERFIETCRIGVQM